jgi:hypothetical protein
MRGKRAVASSTCSSCNVIGCIDRSTHPARTCRNMHVNTDQHRIPFRIYLQQVYLHLFRDFHGRDSLTFLQDLQYKTRVPDAMRACPGCFGPCAGFEILPNRSFCRRFSCWYSWQQKMNLDCRSVRWADFTAVKNSYVSMIVCLPSSFPHWTRRDSVHAGANAEQEIRLARRIVCRQRPTCLAIADIRSSKCKSVWMT